MFIYKRGDITLDPSDVLVFPVHAGRDMNSGLAKEFKRRFPTNYTEYWIQCKTHSLYPGRVYGTLEGGYGRRKRKKKWIIGMCTRYNFYERSKLEYISEGLDSLVRYLKSERWIKSLAIAAVGCGGGRLKWEEVRPLIESKLAPLASKIDVTIYEPEEKQ